MADSALNLRRVYAEICRGYSVERWRDQDVFIKHLNHFDQVDIDLYYEEAYDAARRRKVKTREERLKWLADKGLWVRKDESFIAQQKSFVENMEKTRGKMFLKAQIDQIDTQLKEAREKLWVETNRREELIGHTCEKSADQKIQFYYIHLSCFTDRLLTKRLFTRELIDELDDDDSNDLLTFYVNSINRYSQDSLRRISVANYFTNFFYICGDNIASFFNKPIAELSVYQVNLLSYALYFKSILTNNQVPDDMRENPDKLEEYVLKSRNAKNAIAKAGDGDRVGIVGATAEDLKAMGVHNSTDDMRNTVAKGYTDSRDAARDLGYRSV